MTPKQSKKAFEKHLAAAGHSLATLTPADGVAAMLAFYESQRAEKCPLDEDGDTLLYQWGLYEFVRPATFQLDLTRQFLKTGQDEPYQLSLTFHFTPTPELKAIASGNQWCNAPEDLPAFRKFIANSKAMKAVAALKPTKVELDFNQC